MFLDEKVDVKENSVYNLDPELLNILLFDNTTKENIIWGTDMYEKKGEGYRPLDHLTYQKITGRLGFVIKPRTKKSKIEQNYRVKDKAEVFTPSWMCNIQNNYADQKWFNNEDIFNVVVGTKWKTNKEKIKFPKGKTWIDYIKDLRLEISCGEAPYLVSRYDTVTGDIIKIIERIGLLDRKLRVINENVKSEKEWVEYAILAYKSIYGYEWQGDSLLIARENLLYTFIDYYIDRFKVEPKIDILKQVATIISWNIIQMDGMKFVIPYSCKNGIEYNETLFGTEEIKTECLGCKKDSIKSHNGIYAKTMNWDTNKPIMFVSICGR